MNENHFTISLIHKYTKKDGYISDDVSDDIMDWAVMCTAVIRQSPLRTENELKPFVSVFGFRKRQIQNVKWLNICRAYVPLWMCRLEVWPGFSSSILQFENSTMLIIDVSHKVLRMQTTLDAMYDEYNACRGAPNFKELVSKKIVGQIVLTRCVYRW